MLALELQALLETPAAERLADNGLRYNRFHTTARCSPTRAALLSGRNHHTVGMGGIIELATSAPGYSSMRPDSCAPLAETLKLNGYSTAQFGTCHEVPVWETSPAGPFARWPSPGNGFECFYGFIGGETNQWYPALYEGTTPIEPPKTPEQGYHLTEDLADHAILWARQQKSLMPDKPFFMYFAPGATHAPHHVPKEWSDKHKGKFDHGWDNLREEIFARQQALGVIPQDAEAYATWAGKTLPSDAEWERAARGGLEGAAYVWGDEFLPDKRLMANVWIGQFPWQTVRPDQHVGTMPVGSFPANGYGLYDMAGNVWEWTSDYYAPQHDEAAEHACCAPANPRGAAREASYDPTQPEARIPRKVLKGGSHLCAANYCLRYRPAARSPEMIDTATSHIGFRCVRQADIQGA
jgi:hypothetical protein